MLQKQEDYEEGKYTSPEQNMKAADNHFKNKKQKKTWKVPFEEEEKVLALQTKLKAIKR